MKVILLTDLKNHGKKGQLVKVADGFARNYLIPQKIAVEASAANMANLQKQQLEAQQDASVKSEEAEKVKVEIEQLTLTFKVKSNEGQMFGSVTSKQIAGELLSKNVKIDKRKIISGTPITELGSSIVEIEVYPKIYAKLRVIVESE